MLGENLLPESVNRRRRQVRARVRDLRDPIRERRADLVPGPDVIGRAEESVLSLRDRVVNRDGLIERIRERRNGNSGGGGSDTSGSSGNSNGRVDDNESVV